MEKRIKIIFVTLIITIVCLIIFGPKSYAGFFQTISCLRFGHSWEEATCTSAKKCSRCNITEGKPLGHSYGKPVNTGGSSHRRTCSRCGKSYDERHDFLRDNSKSSCVCGASVGDCTRTTRSDSPWYHDETNHWQLCECLACSQQGAFRTRINIAKHDWDNNKKCNICGYTEVVGCEHDWVEATCLAPAYCKKCNITKGQKGDHSFIYTNTEGSFHRKICVVCNYYSDDRHDFILDRNKSNCVCGASIGQCERSMKSDSPWYHDETNHWKLCECLFCSQTGISPTHVNLGLHNYDKNNKCTSCGYVKTKVCEHDWVEATCLNSAYCKKCKIKKGEPLDHNFKYTNSNGRNYHTKKCTVCGWTTDERHDFLRDNSKSSCVCGASVGDCTRTTRSDSPWYHDETNHWQLCECLFCSQTGILPTNVNLGLHNYDKNGKCTSCGYVKPKVCEHEWEKATCFKPAYCKKCKITEGEPLGHTFEYTDSNGKNYHTKKCTVCGWTTDERHDFILDFQKSNCVCGASIGQCTRSARSDSPWFHDETNHWQLCECLFCSQTGISPTNVNLGLHNYDKNGKCTSCGYIKISYENKPCKTHFFGSWRDVSTNVRMRTCAVCGYAEIQTNTSGEKDIICSNHNYGSWETISNTVIRRVCKICGYNDVRYFLTTDENYTDISLKKDLSLKVGKTFKLIPVIISNNNNYEPKIIWTSSNSKIASVSQSGLVSAKKVGSAVITAKLDNGKKAACKVIVKKINEGRQLELLNIEDENITEIYENIIIAPYGKVLEFTTKANVTVTSDNNNIIEVRENALYTTGTGKVMITASNNTISETQEFFIWNVYLLNKGKYRTYKDKDLKNKFGVLKGKTYLDVSKTENNKVFKIESHLFTKNGASSKDELDGTYIKSYLKNYKTNKSKSKKYKYSFLKDF